MYIFTIAGVRNIESATGGGLDKLDRTSLVKANYIELKTYFYTVRSILLDSNEMSV